MKKLALAPGIENTLGRGIVIGRSKMGKSGHCILYRQDAVRIAVIVSL